MNHLNPIVSLSCLGALALTGALNEDARAQQYQPFVTGDHKSTYSAETSYSGRSSISQGSRDLGEIETFHQSFSYLHSWQYSERFGFEVGVVGQRFNFDAPNHSVVPDHLGSIAIRLGETWKISDQWSARLELQPGIYSDFEDISGGDFNVPMGLGVVYSPRPDLQFIGGLSINLRSQYPVFGGIGMRWKFADDWTLLLGAPRTRIEFRVNDQLTAFAGGDFKGGTFRVAEDFGRQAGRRDLEDQDVNYREIRAGAGARYKFNNYLSLEGEVGWMIDRRFEFDDRNLLLNGDGAPYLRLGIGGTF